MWLAQRAYFRRRGWLAWTVAALGRIGPGFPSLDDLTGERRESAPLQSLEQTVHAVRLWKAALKPIFEGQANS